MCSVSRLGMPIKPILHYAFLACVGEENARNFALGKLQCTFFVYDGGILRKYFHNQ